MYVFCYKNTFYNLSTREISVLSPVRAGECLTAYSSYLSAENVLANIKMRFAKGTLLGELNKEELYILDSLEIVQPSDYIELYKKLRYERYEIVLEE